jgi:hypothetical protein
VRGFPKRAAAEDFYVLNKLAKLGPVARLQGSRIELQSRYSSRVPVGTGPAVTAIAAADDPSEVALFYHPNCYEALKVLLESLPELGQTPQQEIALLLIDHGLQQTLAEQSMWALHSLGIKKLLTHCQRQANTGAQFERQFHQWFDAFRSLKFVHALRDIAWPQQTLRQLDTLQLALWHRETHAPDDIEKLRTRALGLD